MLWWKITRKNKLFKKIEYYVFFNFYIFYKNIKLLKDVEINNK